MDNIAIERSKQKKLDNRVKKIKKKLKKENKTIKVSSTIKKRQGKRNLDDVGVVYLGHIPHGFYEDEIRAYCQQFGRVGRVRVARSQRTGRSKGYAFVEFFNVEVAKIFAETTNNYLMFNRLMVCQYIPPEKRHFKMLWRGATSDDYRAKKNKAMDTELKNRELPQQKEEETLKKNRRKIEDFKTFFEQRGIEFNFKVNDPNVKDDDVASNTISGQCAAVLEIDESDDEVEFNTPPHVIKVFKNAPTGKAATLRRARPNSAAKKFALKVMDVPKKVSAGKKATKLKSNKSKANAT